MGITITFKSTVNMMGMKDTILVRCASGHVHGGHSRDDWGKGKTLPERSWLRSICWRPGRRKTLDTGSLGMQAFSLCHGRNSPGSSCPLYSGFFFWYMVLLCPGWHNPVWSSTRPQVKERKPADHELKPLKSWVKVNVFYFKQFLCSLSQQWKACQNP